MSTMSSVQLHSATRRNLIHYVLWRLLIMTSVKFLPYWHQSTAAGGFIVQSEWCTSTAASISRADEWQQVISDFLKTTKVLIWQSQNKRLNINQI